MPQVVSFTRERPPARFDGVPFTDAQIEEASSSSGPWTLIDTIALTPDANPASPAFRSFTTPNGTGPDLWYRIIYIDALADASLPTDPVQNTEPAIAGDGSGPCTDWITGADVALCCDNADSTDDSRFDLVAAEAQSLLFQLSGRLFAGTCERTVRPCATRCGWGFQVLSRGHIVGWWGSYWGWDSWWANGTPCGCRPLSTVHLAGHPVQEILEVKIDGDIVDPATYRLDRKRDLVRMRDPADPGTVLRWPACQSLDLNDDQPGTFSVTYTYGQSPPLAAVSAASQLACELYKQCIGEACALPKGVTRVIRQGVTIEKPAFVTWGFQSGKARGLPRGWNTGMPLVDSFLNAVNENGLTRRPVFWSPAPPLQYPLPVDS